MRYSIMLQLVVVTTLIMVGSGAFFAWLQNRPKSDPFEGNSGNEAVLSLVLSDSNP
ncbi:hypothetical protein NEA10_02575 [Phormidium yuhuli AB48]|uniref:Uncharacterized protein n=1 Tax=Phormidium yuhuli AB48 TaxID=2940671 RepID=A0ABY5ATG5_9CYAN|nr:hypothetical protein [Phormidium yuhuli]USR91631.1 hypothetical protein NEA10_02575 [Phormidium yuhuli AB48]